MISKVRIPRRIAKVVPKRIAGIKVPGSLRRGPVMSFLTSSRGRLLVVEAAILAGSALLARRVRAARTLTGAAPH